MENDKKTNINIVKIIVEIKQHLDDILDECNCKKNADLEQIEHNVFEIREHLLELIEKDEENCQGCGYPKNECVCSENIEER